MGGGAAYGACARPRLRAGHRLHLRAVGLAHLPNDVLRRHRCHRHRCPLSDPRGRCLCDLAEAEVAHLDARFAHRVCRAGVDDRVGVPDRWRGAPPCRVRRVGCLSHEAGRAGVDTRSALGARGAGCAGCAHACHQVRHRRVGGGVDGVHRCRRVVALRTAGASRADRRGVGGWLVRARPGRAVGGVRPASGLSRHVARHVAQSVLGVQRRDGPAWLRVGTAVGFRIDGGPGRPRPAARRRPRPASRPAVVAGAHCVGVRVREAGLSAPRQPFAALVGVRRLRGLGARRPQVGVGRHVPRCSECHRGGRDRWKLHLHESDGEHPCGGSGIGTGHLAR